MTLYNFFYRLYHEQPDFQTHDFYKMVRCVKLIQININCEQCNPIIQQMTLMSLINSFILWVCVHKKSSKSTIFLQI